MTLTGAMWRARAFVSRDQRWPAARVLCGLAPGAHWAGMPHWGRALAVIYAFLNGGCERNAQIPQPVDNSCDGTAAQ